MAKQIGKGCKACGYKGYFVEDFNDPRDLDGHGQRECPCDLCDSGGVVNAWERYRKVLTTAQQERVRQRVIDGWSLNRAVSNEGIMVLRRYVHCVDDIADLFENGTLEIGEKPETGVAGKVTIEEPGKFKYDKPLPEKVAGGFIPRPKNNE